MKQLPLSVACLISVQTDERYVYGVMDFAHEDLFDRIQNSHGGCMSTADVATFGLQLIHGMLNMSSFFVTLLTSALT